MAGLMIHYPARSATSVHSSNVSFNTWPQVAYITASASKVAVGETTTVSATASDDDGDTLSYQWTAGCSGTWTDSTSRAASFTPDAVPPGEPCGNCPLTVAVEDGRGGRTTGTLRFCVGSRATPSFPPQIETTSQSALTTAAGGSVGFAVSASDPQGSTLSFSWTASTGSLGTPVHEATLSQVTWTAPACVPAGTSASITITVTNAYGLTTSSSFTVNVQAGCSGLTSTFDTDAEGWQITGDAQGSSAQPTYFSTGGNPGGYIHATDNATGGVWYFAAPSRFLSGLAAAYGHELSFDLKQSSTSRQYNATDIILAGNELTLVYDTPYNPGLTWTAYRVRLSESAGWRKGSLSGPTPTQAEFQEVLSNATRLWIRGEFVSGDDNGSLDNVSISPAD
jgi:hypothetical protein